MSLCQSQHCHCQMYNIVLMVMGSLTGIMGLSLILEANIGTKLKFWVEQSWIGRVVHSAVLTAQMVVGLHPKPPPMLVDTCASMWIEKARLQWAGVAPEVNLRITQVRKHTKRDPPWLWNPGLKTGVSLVPRKGLLSSKNLKKRKILKLLMVTALQHAKRP